MPSPSKRIAAIKEILTEAMVGLERQARNRTHPIPSQQEGIVIEPFRKPEQNERAVKGPIRLEDFRQY